MLIEPLPPAADNTTCHVPAARDEGQCDGEGDQLITNHHGDLLITNNDQQVKYDGQEPPSFLPSIESLLQPEGLFLDASDMYEFEANAPTGKQATMAMSGVEEPSQAGNSAYWSGTDFAMGAPVLTPMSSLTASHQTHDSPTLSTQSAPSPKVDKAKKRGRPRSTKALQRGLPGSPNLYAALHKAAEMGGSSPASASGSVSASGTASALGQRAVEGCTSAGMAPQDVFSTDNQQESYSWMSELKGRRKRGFGSAAIGGHFLPPPPPTSLATPTAMDNVTGDQALMASLGMRVSGVSTPTLEESSLSAMAAPNMSPLRFSFNNNNNNHSNQNSPEVNGKLPLMRQPIKPDTDDHDNTEEQREPSEFFMNELFQELLEEQPPPPTATH